jgi:Kef-type K+ transport system membrane component KefB
MYEEIRTAIEIASAIMCFILLRFMIKPYEMTGENRYIGLPLGFGFLGATYAISALAYYIPRIFGPNTIYFQLVMRTFAFLFIAITYYFSKKITKNSRLIWKTTLAVLIAASIILFLILSIPNDTLPDYRTVRNYFRVLNLIIILYICVHTFRNYVEKSDSKTILLPLSFTILLVSQYSTLLFQLDESLYSFFAGLILRLIFLSTLLFVSFGSFYRIKARRRS